MSTFKGKILFVDDDLGLCEAVMTLMQMNGFDCKSAHSRPQALDMLKADTFSVVFTDLFMTTPECGINLCKDICDNFPEIPVILVTGFPSFTAAAIAMQAGAQDFLTKPFEFEDLVESLKTIPVV